MQLKTKILLLAILPLLLLTAGVTLVALNQARALGEQEIQTFERNLIASKEQALRDYVSLALTSISHLHGHQDLDPEDAQAQVKAILRDLTYGDDGYFFVYDDNGTNLVHPVQPELEGHNLIELTDDNGTKIIVSLLDLARSGGGFLRYQWLKPSLNRAEDKLSYVVQLKDWEWMLGTGLYLDDIAQEVTKIREQVNRNIRNTFFTVLVFTAVTVILIVMIGIAFNVHEHMLADAKLRDLARRSMQFQISERRRFSRELHDGINQLMVSVKYRLELAQSTLKKQQSGAEEHLSKGQEVLNDAIREVRQISHDMRPTVLDDLGLLPALKSLLGEFAERTGVQVELDVDLAQRQLTEEIDITFYRVVQEALTNVERYADASVLTLKGYWNGNSFRIEIRDNGCGFDLTDKIRSDGIGLRNMRERIELLGGRFNMESTRGGGTWISAQLPVELYS
ncbi:histidine kinase [Motiliproteus coralliicola]|uniref:Oxygen sensor histidine kinase NreB n=1 Tax=Motiliproteus coralliicola TaxID=2283196 RepID=A0A369WRU3_9GAMM|nr:cache domain-containing protein [Motiliproteus coralliicola]RDE24830.1 histidine kinase [Motiliproteus coralliicola]